MKTETFQISKRMIANATVLNVVIMFVGFKENILPLFYISLFLLYLLLVTSISEGYKGDNRPLKVAFKILIVVPIALFLGFALVSIIG